MSKQVQFRRGTTAQHSSFTGADGEMTIDTTKKTIVVHDGSTAGGFPSITEAGGTITGNLSVTGTVDGRDLSVDGTKLDGVENNANRKNKNTIINGNFDIWQRGTSTTETTGYHADDRWINRAVGATHTASRQTFTLGQTDVPNNPKYYSRTVVVAGSTSSDHARKQQWIEYISTFAGEEVTFSFWAKADASRSLSTEFVQDYGTGGSPSSTVSGISVVKHSLTTSWQRFTVTTTLPSISGTLGTDDNDALGVFFWFDAGSDYNSRTNTLGHQSGTFEIAQVQLEKGGFATDFERRTIGDELALCQRYYSKSYNFDVDPGTIDGAGSGGHKATVNGDSEILFDFPVSMRITPTVVLYNPVTGLTSNPLRSGTTNHPATVYQPGTNRVTCYNTSQNSLFAYNIGSIHYTADSEL